VEQWIAGGIIGGLAVVVVGLALPRRKCPNCGEQFPRWRVPASGRQALWGGGTCAKCGCEVDRRGRKVERR
jgi:hypothetical protein